MLWTAGCVSSAVLLLPDQPAGAEGRTGSARVTAASPGHGHGLSISPALSQRHSVGIYVTPYICGRCDGWPTVGAAPGK